MFDFLEKAWDRFAIRVGDFAPLVPISLIIFVLFFVGGLVLAAAIRRFGAAREIDPALIHFMERAVKTIMILFGIVTALAHLGVNVTALVAGLGLTGFALGFALKDILANSLAGMLIIIYRPFTAGVHIKVSSFEGTVTAIDLRYTVLDAGGQTIYVPNQMLFSNAVTVTRAE